MNGPDPLAQLSPLREPAAITAWPPAPGWWLLLACSLAAVGLLAVMLWRRHQANAYRRQALRQIEQLHSSWHGNLDQQAFIIELNGLLKAAALQVFPAEQVAPLHGRQWLEFLSRSAPGLKQLPDAYASAPYSTRVAIDIEEITRYATRWVRQHRRPT
jgi:hypothetical protein